MSGEPDNILLVYLRRIDANVQRLTEDMADVKRRVTALEVSNAHLHADYAGLQLRMDRLDSRLERIERRLDLQEAAP